MLTAGVEMFEKNYQFEASRLHIVCASSHFGNALSSYLSLSPSLSLSLSLRLSLSMFLSLLVSLSLPLSLSLLVSLVLSLCLSFWGLFTQISSFVSLTCLAEQEAPTSPPSELWAQKKRILLGTESL